MSANFSPEEADNIFNILRPLQSYGMRNSLKMENCSAQMLNPDHLPCNYDFLKLAFQSKFWKFDYTDQLSRLKVNTLILCGAEDWMVDPSFSK